MKIDPNGPAFATPSMKQLGTVEVDKFLDFEEEGSPGLTVRAYIAAQVLAGLLSGRHEKRDKGENHKGWKLRLAEFSVEHADALIAELNKETT